MINDPRYNEIKLQEELMLAENSKNTNDLLTQNTSLTQNQNTGLEQQQATQEKLVDTSTEAAIKQYENQIAKSEQGYKTESGAAYADYQKFVNPYGNVAESQAASGLLGSKVTESGRISAHNSYQERVGKARSSFEAAKTEFEIATNEARQNGDIQKAQLAYEIFQQKAENTLREFQYASQLRLTQEQTILGIQNSAYDKTQNLQGQINYEQQTQYQKEMDAAQQQYQAEQDRIAQMNYEQEQNYQKELDAWKKSYQIEQDKITQKKYEEEAAYQKALDAWEQQYKKEQLAISKAQEEAALAEEKRQANMNYSLSVQKKQEAEENSTPIASSKPTYASIDKTISSYGTAGAGIGMSIPNKIKQQEVVKSAYQNGYITQAEAIALATKYKL